MNPVQTSFENIQALGHGIYTYPEAARLVGVESRRIRAWFKGMPGRPGPVIHGEYDADAISFAGLIDSLVVGKLREFGVSMQYLRKVHEQLLHEFDMPHPFCRKNLLTDGRRVWIELADVFGEWQLKEVLTQQHAFPSILRNSLQPIEYDSDTLLAKQWNVFDNVIVNPKIKYGKPVVKTAGIPTAILAAAYEANSQDEIAVANWYDITIDEVRAAVQFEQHMGRQVA